MSIYAVNGKEPIGAWIPSRPLSGVGSTTLADLVGSNHGTLTDMDAATDWVSDTGAGGVRALDFDGTDDYVNCGTIPGVNGASQLTLSGWIWKSSTSHTVAFGCAAGMSNFSAGSRFSAIWFSDGNLYCSAGAESAFSIYALSGTGWRHIALCFDGSLTGNSERFKLYIDGTLISNSIFGTVPSTLSTVVPDFALGKDSSNRFAGGRIDDVRLWDQTLDSTDIDYLYDSGNGRGIVGTLPSQNRRRLSFGGFGL